MDFNKDQKEIIYDTSSKNILVSAAAGSGKTTVLTERIIHCISEVKDKKDEEISLSDILIMTFTKKATAEMRARINKRLAREIKDTDVESPKYKKLIKESALIQNANIMTIDAFCKKILEENYTYLSEKNSLYYDFDISYKIGDDKEIALLKEEVLDSFLEFHYKNDKYKDLFDSYVEKNNETLLRTLLLDGLNYLAVTPWPVEYLDDQIKYFKKYSSDAYVQYVDNCVKEYEKLKDSCSNVTQTIDDEIEIVGTVIKNRKKDDAIKDNFNKLLKQLNKLHDMVYEISIKNDLIVNGEKLKKFNEKKFEQLANKIGDIQNNIPVFPSALSVAQDIRESYQENKNTIINLCGLLARIVYIKNNSKYDENVVYNNNELLYLNFLKEFYIKVLNEKKKRNIYEISDYASITLDILYDKKDGDYGTAAGRDISKNAKDIAEKYKLIFIDEYQDTNYVQETILKALSNNFKKGNVFMVGDVKQSIYKFRNAEPANFVEKYNSYLNDKDDENKNGILKTLDINYRSSIEIIGYVNDLFKKAMTDKYGGIEYKNGHEFMLKNEKKKYDIVDDNKVEIKVVYQKNKKKKDDTSSSSKSSDTKNETISAESSDKENESKNTEKSNESGDGSKKESDNIIEKRSERVIDIEADYVATKIEDLVKNKGKQYRDIVILLRSPRGRKSQKGKAYEDALKRHKIPVFMEQTAGFFSRLEIRFMVDLLAAIDNPLQNIPLASVLCSKVFNFTNDELALMKVLQNEFFRIGTKTVEASKSEDVNLEKYKNYYLNVYDQLKYIQKCYNIENGLIDKENDESKTKNSSESKEESNKYKVKPISKEELDAYNEKLSASSIDKVSFENKVNYFLKILKELQFKSRYISVSNLIDYIYNKLNVREIMGTMIDGKMRVANLNMLYDLAISFERTSNVFLFNFNRYIERIKEIDLDSGLAKINDENANAVRIMTIHTSKGLEFDTVFLCAANSKYNFTDTEPNALYQFDRKNGFALDYYNVSKKMILQSPKKSLIANREIDAIKQEELRMLYVALTRAVNKLYIIGNAGTGGNAGLLKKELDDFEAQKKEMKNIELDIENCESYLDVILSKYPVKNEKYCNFESIEWEIKDIIDDSEEIETNVIYEENDREKNVVNNPENKDYFDAIAESKLDKDLVDSYPYKELQLIDAKYAVTNIKGEEGRATNRSEYTVEDEDEGRDEVKTSKSAYDRLEIGGAELGNAYHRYMQFYDYKQNKLGLEIANGVDLSFADNVSKNKIDKFLKTHVGQEMKEAAIGGKLYREHKFMKLFSQNEIDEWKNKYADENDKPIDDKNKSKIFDEKNVIIQGIIDAFYVKDDGNGNEHIVLVDYKTDEINANDLKERELEDELKNRHGLQLNIYAKVLNELTGLPVKEKYIYSFALDKEVALD